jgi:hypothetical protein
MRGAFRRTTIIPHLHHVYRNLDDGVHSEGLPVRISGKTLMASADPSIHPLVAAFDIEGGSTTCRAIERFAAKKRCVSPGGSDCRSGLCADPGAAWIFARAHDGDADAAFRPHDRGRYAEQSGAVTSRHVCRPHRAWLRGTSVTPAGMDLSALVMSASTLFVHQHHLLDVATGLGLAAAVRRVFPLDEAPARNGI